jgi:hypothetical protein
VCKKSGIKYFRDFKKKELKELKIGRGEIIKKLLKFTTEKHSRQNAHAR